MALAATLTHSYLSERCEDPNFGAAPNVGMSPVPEAAPNTDVDADGLTLKGRDGTDGVVSMGMCCATSSAATP